MAGTFKGLLNAFDFAYGINPTAAGALQVISGSNGTGSYTITCQPKEDRSSDGIAGPISTSTPITIGASSGIETVTPTAVSINNLNQILITATFANAHAAGAQVRSGSGGLQEAAGYALNQGGGCIALTPQWFATVGIALTNKNGASGLTAYLAALKSLSANITVLDYSGSSGATAATQASSWTAAAAAAYALAVARLY